MNESTEYTRDQIEAGEGLLVRGRTMIVGTPRGGYITADPQDRVNVAAGYYLAGGGVLLADGTARIDWCE